MRLLQQTGKEDGLLGQGILMTKENKIHIQVPKDVAFILRLLEQEGHEAYAVGGCVRDSLLDRQPKDWDITTSALPEQVKAIFHRTIDTGIQHGTVTVMMHHTGYEVTTYRIDGEYKDGRHPKTVEFTSKLAEDLQRRDFTINAMAYNPKTGVVDIFDGIGDLNRKVIRCVGKAQERFSEDALRILRAVRFAAQLGFHIEDKTREGLRELAENLSFISKERIQVELDKLLCSDNPGHMRILYETGVSKVILPQWDAMMETQQNHPYHCYSVGEHTIKAMESVPPDHYLRWCMLLHDVAKPVCRTTDRQGIDHFYGHQKKGSEMAEEILRGLKWDNRTIDWVTRLVYWHDYQVEPRMKIVRRSIVKIGEDIYPYFLQVKLGDMLAQSDINRQERQEALAEIGRMYKTIIEQKHCLKLSDLTVSGRDLLAVGIPTGTCVGNILNALMEWVLDNPEYNQKDLLMEKVEELRKEMVK